MDRKLIVCDIGASSARVFTAAYDGTKISLHAQHRFLNKPIIVGDSLYWDIFALYEGLKCGIAAAGKNADSIGIDSYSNDYLLFDKTGAMIEPPHTYRDARTLGMVEEMDRSISRKELYYRTGLQFNRMNSLYQWLSMAKQRPWMMETADSLLFVPDALIYFLCGEKVTEYTLASVSQGYNPSNAGWDLPLLKSIGFSSQLLQGIIQPGETAGRLTLPVCEELSVKPLPVIAVGEHDTASAIAAVPSLAPRFAYISSGTWSIVGTEIDKPLINEKSYRHGLANEGGVGGRIRLLKNVMGLWILQECKRYWQGRGSDYSYAQLSGLATRSEWEQNVFDPDDELFYQPGPMPELIARYFESRGEQAPHETGDVVRCVLLSLACKYRYVLDCLEYACGYELPVIHIVGGGAQNALLNQLTANITGKPVCAGPYEATAFGNAMVQLIAAGEFESLSDARSALIRSADTQDCLPDGMTKWQELYARFRAQTCLLPVE
jgi:rhamnulokinase